MENIIEEIKSKILVEPTDENMTSAEMAVWNSAILLCMEIVEKTFNE